jgi:hypothetical protein
MFEAKNLEAGKKELEQIDVTIPEVTVDPAAFDRPDLQRLKLFFYFIPVFGLLPALWSLYGQSQTQETGEKWKSQEMDGYRRRDRAFSRLSVTLTLSWLITLGVANTGGTISEIKPLFLLLFNSTVTSSYILTNLWLMVQLARRRRIWLPGLSDWGENLPSKK